MALPVAFRKVLVLLGQAFQEYERLTGSRAILVGGSAVSIFTRGGYLSGDFDVLAAHNDAFDAALQHYGFQREDRAGRRLGGWYHPAYPGYSIDSVSKAYFDGLGDIRRVQVISCAAGSKINIAPVEDLIADRLGQYAQAPRDRRSLNQAKMMKKLATRLDRAYLERRVRDEGGDISLIDDD